MTHPEAADRKHPFIGAFLARQPHPPLTAREPRTKATAREGTATAAALTRTLKQLEAPTAQTRARPASTGRGAGGAIEGTDPAQTDPEHASAGRVRRAAGSADTTCQP